MGVMLPEWGDSSHPNCAQKRRVQLEWAYQIAHENNQRESEWHRKYYDCKLKCMSLRPDDLVLVHVKAPTGDYKIADHWETTPHHVLSQLVDQLVLRIQSVDADEGIHVLHRNMLFPIQSATTDNHDLALEKANKLICILIIEVHLGYCRSNIVDLRRRGYLIIYCCAVVQYRLWITWKCASRTHCTVFHLGKIVGSQVWKL